MREDLNDHCDVLLVNPPWVRREGNIWREVSDCREPIGLICLAGYLRDHGHAVRILDMEALRLLPSSLSAFIGPWPLPRLIGLSVNTSLYYAARDTIPALRALYPGVPVVVGGVHPTIRPEECLTDLGADFAVRGEGELPALRLLEGCEPDAVPGLSWLEDGVYRSNPRPEPWPDLDRLPPAAYDLLPMDRYAPPLGSFRRLPAASMVTSRGCPGRCTFCFGALLSKRWRFYSAARIYQDIDRLVRDYGVREISFYDDTFTVNPGLVELCEALARRSDPLTWVCFARADSVDEEKLRLMKRAGCHQIMFGLESADEQILKNIRKRFMPDVVERAVRASQRVGIDVRLAVMFGNPGETVQTIRRTVDFVKRLNPELVIANITTPYPGTEMFDWADRHDYLLTRDWDAYDLSRCVMALPTISVQDVESAYRSFYREFYFRPSFIARRLRRLTSWQEIKWHYRSFQALMGFGRAAG